MTLQEYFWALPNPLLSYDDIAKAPYPYFNTLSMTWETWSKAPIKAAALRAIFSGLGGRDYHWDMAPALAQTHLVHLLCSYLLQAEEVHN
jgi:hypothetical protein